MRRSLILPAVSIAAFAWGLSADTAAGADKQVYYTITLQEGRLGAAPPSAGGSVAKVDGFTVKQGVKPMTYKLDPVFVKSWSTSAAPRPLDGPMFRVHDDKNSGAATGINRMVIVTNVSGGCTVGKRYPTATLAGGGKRFVLTDVRITGCSRAGPEEQITFVYGSLGIQ